MDDPVPPFSPSPRVPSPGTNGVPPPAFAAGQAGSGPTSPGGASGPGTIPAGAAPQADPCDRPPGGISHASLVASVLLFLAGWTVGWIGARAGWWPGPRHADAGALHEEIRARVSGPPMANLGRIFGRNTLVLAILCLGIGTAGLATAVQILGVGAFAAADVVRALRSGVDRRLVFCSLVPHALPELVAFCLAGSVGLHGAVMLIRYLRGGPLVRPGEARELLVRAGVSLAVLLVAGLLEAFVTPALARRFL